jgi:fibronectin-binding autotransporter adhesin
MEPPPLPDEVSNHTLVSPMQKSASANLALLAFLSLGLGFSRLTAADYVVTSNADNGSAGTLRAAIIAANANAGSTITFTDNLGTITLAGALPPITAATTISGGTGNTVSGNNLNRIFYIDAASAAVSISGLNLANGSNKGANGNFSQGGNLGAGGAIYVHAGALQISGVAFQDNSVVGGAGGAVSYGTSFRSFSPGVSPSYIPPYGIGGNFSDFQNLDGTGSRGGFGGGGGGSSYYSLYHPGGAGGEFAGNGGSVSNYGAPAINERVGGGGGGAGLGGAIFVEGTNGASLTIVGAISESGGAATGGAAGSQSLQLTFDSNLPAAGLGVGGAFFLTGGSTTLESGVLQGSIGLSDNASFIKNGPGTLVIELGLSAYSGATVAINDGNLQLGTTNSSAPSALGVITGAGSLSALGTGTLTLSGSSPAFSGAITLGGPQVFVGNTLALGTGAVSIHGGEIHTDGTPRTVANALTLDGSIVVGRSLTFTGDAALNSDLTLTANNPSGAANANTVFTGVLSGAHSLTLQQGANGIGTGAIVLGADNTYTGGTTIASGRLQIGSGGTTGSVLGNIVNHGAVVINRSNDWTYANVISGTGTLTKQGAGNLTLSGANTYAGGTTVSAGTLTGNTTSLQGPIVNNAALVFAQATDGASSGAISGTGSLTKTGSGVLTLNGPNTYTGATTISGGTLLVAGTLSTTALNITASGGALDLNGTTQTLGSLTGVAGSHVYLGSGSLTIGGNNTSTTYAGDLLDGGVSAGTGGALVKVGSGALTLTGTNTYSGGTTLTAGMLSFNSMAALGTGALALNGGTLRFLAADLDISTRALTVGAAGTTLDLNGNNTTFSQGINVGGTNRITVTGAGTLTLANVATPIGGLLTNNASLIYTVPTDATLPVLNGSGTLTLNGGGNVMTLPTGSAWNGTTNINSGTLKLSATNNLGVGQIVNFADTAGATLDLNNFSHSILQLTGGGANGGLVKLGSATLTITGTPAATPFAGKITGTGGVTFNNNFTLGGSGSDYNGTTRISAYSTLTLASANALSPNSVLVLDYSGFTKSSVYLQGHDQTVSGITNFGDIYLGGATLTVAGSGSPGSWIGSAFGEGRIVKNGTGTFAIGGSIPALTLNSGNLALESGAAISALDVYGGGLTNAPRSIYGVQTYLNLNLHADLNVSTLLTLKGNIYLAGNAGLTLGNASGSANADTIVNGQISGAAGQGITISAGVNGVGTGAIVFNATVPFTGAPLPNTYTGATTLESGRLAISGDANLGAATAPLVFSGGTLKITGPITGTRPVSVAADGGTIESNGFSALFGGFTGSGILTKTGTGNLGVSGTSTFTGTLAMTSGSFVVASTGNFQLGNGGTSGTLDRPISNNGVFAFNRSDNLSFSQVLSGTGQFSQIGTGTLTLNAANTYSGGTMVAAGTLRLGNATALGTSGNVTLSGGTLDLNGFSQTFTQLTATGGTITNNGTSAVALTVGVPSGTSVFQGTLADGVSAIGLTKTGAGTLTLSSANNYSGGTTISAGTARINNSTGSAFGTGAVTIAQGATLTGAGSFTGALQLNGTYSPGNSPGQANTGSQTWAGGGSYIWEINEGNGTAGTHYDLLNITGSLTIAATTGNRFTLSLVSLLANNTAGDVIDFNTALNHSYTIATTSSGILGFSSNAFTLNTSGFSNDLNGGSWNITQSGNNVNLNFISASAIPEPSTYAALAGLAALGLAFYRKRRRA